jgi:hypothetical protein
LFLSGSDVTTGYDLVALYRWAVLRAFFMAVRGFTAAGRRNKKMGKFKTNVALI